MIHFNTVFFSCQRNLRFFCFLKLKSFILSLVESFLQISQMYLRYAAMKIRREKRSGILRFFFDLRSISDGMEPFLTEKNYYKKISLLKEKKCIRSSCVQGVSRHGKADFFEFGFHEKSSLSQESTSGFFIRDLIKTEKMQTILINHVYETYDIKEKIGIIEEETIDKKEWRNQNANQSLRKCPALRYQSLTEIVSTT